jgi:hypothetical protein
VTATNVGTVSKKPGTGPRRRGHVETAPSRPATTKSRVRTPPSPAVGVVKVQPAALEWQESSLPLLGRLRAAGWLPTALLAISVVALVYLLQTSAVATTGYDIQRLQTERADWQLRNEQLRLELAKRRSLTWVEAEAVGRLGMQRPDSGSLTYLRTTR